MPLPSGDLQNLRQTRKYNVVVPCEESSNKGVYYVQGWEDVVSDASGLSRARAGLKGGREKKGHPRLGAVCSKAGSIFVD